MDFKKPLIRQSIPFLLYLSLCSIIFLNDGSVLYVAVIFCIFIHGAIIFYKFFTNSGENQNGWTVFDLIVLLLLTCLLGIFEKQFLGLFMSIMGFVKSLTVV